MIDLLAMYPGAVNSPETFITAGVSETDTSITVQNAAGLLPTIPCLLVLGGSFSNAETVLVTAAQGNTLTVERARQGVAQEWPQGTTIACNFTEAHYRALMDNIKALGGGLNQLSRDFASAINDMQPTAEIIELPITQSDYFGAWDLLLCEGGINAPLEAWGFTNATLTTLPSRNVVDINTDTVTVYSIPIFGGLAWSIKEYQSGVFILTAKSAALILIRR